MKKPKGFLKTSVVLAICLSMLSAAIPCSAQQDGTTVEVGSVYASKDSSIEVPITVSTSGLYAIQLKVTIPDGLTPDTGDFANDEDFPCPGLKAGTVFTDVSGKYSNRVFDILLTNGSLADVIGSNITLLTLCLKVDDSVANGDILPVNISVGANDASDISENSIPVSAKSGSVIIMQTPSINVDVIWGGMEFTYSDGTWDPQTHTYKGAGWTSSDNANKITVINNSNIGLTVRYEYTKEFGYEEITGKFTDGTNEVTSVELSENESRDVYLVLENKPKKSIASQKIGTVTVSISDTTEKGS